MRILLNNVPVSFPSIFKKARYKGEETKYEGTFILDKKEHAKEIEIIQKEIDRVLAESFNTTRAKFSSERICLKDGDESENEKSAGKFTIKATNNEKPKAVDLSKRILTEDNNPFYSGAIVNAAIGIWPMNNTYGKKILANLYGIQFVKDGIRLGDNSYHIENCINDFDSFDLPFEGNTEEDDLFG